MHSKSPPSFILILHNIRSAHNVGAMFRTADGAGVAEIILSGYTPVPAKKGALYLTDADKALHKTALGAEYMVPWRKVATPGRTLTLLKKSGFTVVALEQMKGSVPYQQYKSKGPVALIVGNEVRGIDQKILKQCDTVLEIPMRGAKNSLNVSVACGIALYQITATMREGGIKNS